MKHRAGWGYVPLDGFHGFHGCREPMSGYERQAALVSMRGSRITRLRTKWLFGRSSAVAMP